MRQHTRGSLLAELFRGDFTHQVDVEVQQTGDIDNPGWQRTSRAMSVIVQVLSAQERVVRSEQYDLVTTAQGFCDDAPELIVGSRWVETARRTEAGEWESVDPDHATVWLVQGKQAIPGVPEPTFQVRVDLHQMSPTRGGERVASWPEP